MKLPFPVPYVLLFPFVSLLGCGATGSGTNGEGAQDGGATDAVDYGALFGPPSSQTSTADKLDGLWAGTGRPGFIDTDIRLELSSVAIVVAQKCLTESVPQTDGLTVAARISATSIQTLESKTTPTPVGVSSSCGITVRPVEIVRCKATSEDAATTESASLKDGCFLLSGTNLGFYNSIFGNAKLTKLRD